MKVGVCFLTLDRFEITRRTILEVLAKTGHSDFELYVCDNGSDDRRTLEFVESLNPFYFRKNPTNEGVSRGFNQLLVRTVKRCDAVVLLGNDIDMPNNWLSTFIDYHQRIGEPTGIIGIECAIPIRQKAMVVNGTKIYAASGTGKSQDGIFGVWYVPKKVIEKVGYFYEFPAPYGLEDSEYNHRVFLSKFISFYIPELKSAHVGSDSGQKTEYRKMKNDSLQINLPVYTKRIEELNATNCFVHCEER